MSMISKDNLEGLIAVLAGMLIIGGVNNVTVVTKYMAEKPMWVVIFGLILFFGRKYISDKVCS